MRGFSAMWNGRSRDTCSPDKMLHQMRDGPWVKYQPPPVSDLLNFKFPVHRVEALADTDFLCTSCDSWTTCSGTFTERCGQMRMGAGCPNPAKSPLNPETSFALLCGQDVMAGLRARDPAANRTQLHLTPLFHRVCDFLVGLTLQSLELWV